MSDDSRKFRSKANFIVSRNQKRGLTSEDRRINVLFYAALAFSFLIIFRLFSLQVLEYKFYFALASDQHEIYQQLFPRRGEIFMQDYKSKGKDGSFDLYPLATNKEYNLLYAVPKDMNTPSFAAKELARIIQIPEAELLAKFTKKDDPYEAIKHRVSDEEATAIKKLNLKGIKFADEVFRYYPEKNMASHLTGFLGFSKEKQMGQYGLEGYFDKQLSGEQGYLKSEKDRSGALVGIYNNEVKRANNGSDLVLTVDRTIESVACDKIKAGVEKYGAVSGSIVIMDPKTGAIFAMCSYPDFNPNEYSKTEDINVFNNPAIFTAYEPGSVFKPITMAAALDTDKVNPDTTYIDEGFVKIGKYTIKNSDGLAHGEKTMTELLEESLNTGTIFLVRKTGNDIFRKYVQNFDFGKLTGIELDTEVAGGISLLEKSGEIYSATASFGQGITVTPIQLVTAFAAIANGGNLVKPYIINEIREPDGTKIDTKPKIIRRVMSERTSSLLSGMLVSVVEKGHGKKAGVNGYYVAGKTGTAQVPKANGDGYEPDMSIGTFAGFAPVEDPKFVMLVKIDRPANVQWAESSAAPIFGEMAKFLLDYFQVAPHR
jgi:cell division protein FtsI/penicillin-binding protein 2